MNGYLVPWADTRSYLSQFEFLEHQSDRIGHNGYLGGCLVCWKSLKHKMDFSTCVTEYMGFVIAGKRILFIRALLRALSIQIYQTTESLLIDGIEQEDISPCSVGPSILFSDNEAAINLSYNPVLHQRTSHVNRLYHDIRTWIKHRVITVQKVPTGDNNVDIHTKCFHEKQEPNGLPPPY